MVYSVREVFCYKPLPILEAPGGLLLGPDIFQSIRYENYFKNFRDFQMFWMIFERFSREFRDFHTDK